MTQRLFGLPRRWFGLKPMASAWAVLLAVLLMAPISMPHHHPVAAQTLPNSPPSPDPLENTDAEQGFSLIEQGAKLLMRGLMTEIEPALDEMDKAMGGLTPQLQALGPQLAELARLMGDFRNYDLPVVLENGDILIRRTAPMPPPAKPSPPQQAPESGPGPSVPKHGLPLAGPQGQTDL